MPEAPRQPPREKYSKFSEDWIIQSTAFAHAIARYARSVVSEETLMMRDTIAPDKVAENIWSLVVALNTDGELLGSQVQGVTEITEANVATGNIQILKKAAW